MAEWVPVDHDPFDGSGPTWTPIDHDPFEAVSSNASTPRRRSVLDKLFGLTGEREQLLPERMVRSGATLARDMITGEASYVPGLRREDVTDKPRPGGWKVSAEPNDAVIERAGDMAGLAMLGAVPAPAGARGAGPVRRLAPLPMDEASRMQRATEMGFDVKKPVYHGSAAEFRQFDPARLGETTRAPSARQGFFAAEDSDIASRFAALAAQSGRGEQVGFPQVYPLFARSENPGVLRLTGRETDLDVAGALAGAFDQGLDSVWLRYPGSGSGLNKDALVVKNPNQFRSRFAAFDPERRDSADLLANVAGVSLAGGTLYGFLPWSNHSPDE